MRIGHATLERLLVVLFNLSETQRAALTGRIKYLQRLDGLGAAAAPRGRLYYDVHDLLRTVVIFELVDIGCSPTRSARIVRTHQSDLFRAFVYAWRDVQRQRSGAAARQPGIGHLLWTLVPHALQELGAGATSPGVAVPDRAAELEPHEVLPWTPTRAGAGDRHAIFINLPRLLAAIDEALGRVTPAQQARFRDELCRRAARLPRDNVRSRTDR